MKSDVHRFFGLPDWISFLAALTSSRRFFPPYPPAKLFIEFHHYQKAFVRINLVTKTVICFNQFSRRAKVNIDCRNNGFRCVLLSFSFHLIPSLGTFELLWKSEEELKPGNRSPPLFRRSTFELPVQVGRSVSGSRGLQPLCSRSVHVPARHGGFQTTHLSARYVILSTYSR